MPRVYRERGMIAIADNNLFKFAPVLGQLLAESAVKPSSREYSAIDPG
jgi:hypothetical protein